MLGNEDPCPTERQMSKEILVLGWFFESTQMLLSMRVCQLMFQSSQAVCTF